MDGGFYLVKMLADYTMLGWYAYDAMGNKFPHSWNELYCFARATGEIAEGWEFSQLRAMSAEYLAGLDIGKEPLGIPPTGIGGTLDLDEDGWDAT